MGEARTCSAQQSVFDASSRANAGAGQQVQCPNLQSSAALAICRRNGFRYLGPWAGPLTPPAGFNWARHTFTPQCEAFKQVSQVVTRRPGTVCPIAVAKVQFMMACGVVCER